MFIIYWNFSSVASGTPENTNSRTARIAAYEFFDDERTYVQSKADFSNTINESLTQMIEQIPPRQQNHKKLCASIPYLAMMTCFYLKSLSQWLVSPKEESPVFLERSDGFEHCLLYLWPYASPTARSFPGCQCELWRCSQRAYSLFVHWKRSLTFWARLSLFPSVENERMTVFPVWWF